jgi:hypothetical protein
MFFMQRRGKKMSFEVHPKWKHCHVRLLDEALVKNGYQEASFAFCDEQNQVLANYELAPCSFEHIREALDSLYAAGFIQTQITAIHELTNICLNRQQTAA